MIKVTKSFKRFSLVLTVVVLAVIFASYTFCNRENKDQVLVQLVTQTLSMAHFSPVEINDEFSKKVYDLYIKQLDFGKRFFTKEDLKQLEPYKTKIDDQIASKSIEFYAITNEIFNKSIERAKGYYTEILSKPFDLTENETFETDPEKNDFAKNDAQLKEFLAKSLKYMVLVRVSDMLETQRKTKSDSIKQLTLKDMEADARGKILKLYTEYFKRISKTPDNERFGIFLNAITGIYDPHTQYMPQVDEEAFMIRMSGQFEGIGAQLLESEGYIKVVNIVPGSASWLQGELKAEDIILKVAQEGKEPVDVYDMRIEDVVQLIRGKKGTKVTLTVKKIDKTVKDITITRNVVIMEETYAKSAILEGKNGKVGYLYLPQFYANFEQTETGRASAEDVAKEIEKLKKENVSGIILDLRNNGGGSLGDAVKMGGLFIKRGPIVQVKTKNGSAKVLEDYDPSVQYDGALVVMVNGFSASASEILAAAMQDYGRAIIIGSPSTFGKGTVQTRLELDNYINASYKDLRPLGSLLVTIQKFYRINGGATQLKGVTPDIILPDPYSSIEMGEREQEYCMPWTKINPVSYTPWQGLTNRDQIIQKEMAAIKNNPDFKVIEEQAQELKKQHSLTLIPLNINKYQKNQDEAVAKSKRFEDIAKKANGLNIRSLVVDMEEAKGDTATLARTDSWIKGLSKDLYLKEAVQVIGFINQK